MFVKFLCTLGISSSSESSVVLDNGFENDIKNTRVKMPLCVYVNNITLKRILDKYTSNNS